MFRSVVGCTLNALFDALMTIGFVLVSLVLAIFKPLYHYKFMYAWPKLMLWGVRVFCGIKHEVIGAENIPDGSIPHIVLSKHSSTWEVCALPLVMPRPLCFVAKRELMWIPIFGWGFKLIKPITIDRKAGGRALQQLRTQGEARLKEGFWIIIYPEGTRVPPGKNGTFKTGGAHLATQLNVPVIPVAHNAGYFWPRGTYGKRPGTITLSIGKPISPEGKDPKTLMKEVEEWVVAETERLGRGKSEG